MSNYAASIPENKLALRSCLLSLLQGVNDLDEQENLVYYGLGSLQIMNLSIYWRNAGLAVNFIDLVKTPTLAAWWQLIEEKH
ncbi:hypothetical protein TW85_08615 [Marinomonas sp. S3726]|uniref:hypothetical protein n=1 Tax=Marinomonas sp. S3726 TaxID=579484 RepID=UPI0005FA7CB3|nr:hypothetical protein [Marinomonas sp. S3726]KJZ14772.1 hypothetical protein TW85_08615 [Marinomonas sp. S3726]